MTDTVAAMDDDHHEPEAAPAGPTRDPETTTDPVSPKSQSSVSPWLLLGLLIVGGLALTNFLLLSRVANLEADLDAAFARLDADVAAISGSVDSVSGSVGDVSAMVDGVEERLDELNALALASSDGNASAAPEGQVGAVGAGLPRYDPAGPDPALGVVIDGFEGLEYYSGQTLAIDAADGKSRAWLVWAHWCPYCQQEMPELKSWVEVNSASMPNFEVVSITAGIDESRGNPLVPYLEELQLPFPVIVDEDGSLSAQLGLNAFPFWVFTGPDGTVLGRSAGLLGPTQFVSIFEQLEAIAASA